MQKTLCSQGSYAHGFSDNQKCQQGYLMYFKEQIGEGQENSQV